MEPCPFRVHPKSSDWHPNKEAGGTDTHREASLGRQRDTDTGFVLPWPGSSGSLAPARSWARMRDRFCLGTSRRGQPADTSLPTSAPEFVVISDTKRTPS